MLSVGTVVELDTIDKTLAKLGADVANLRPAFFRIDQDVSERLREQFQSRGAALGSPWTPITPATIQVRIARRILTKKGRAKAAGNSGADTPLRDSGRLFASFTKPGAPGNIRLIDKMTYQRGSNYSVNGFPVAMAMQDGFMSTMRPVFDENGDAFFVRRKVPKQVPARPIIPENLPAPVLKAWEGYLQQYIEHGTLT